MDFQNWMDLITAVLTVFAGVITYGAHKLFTAKTKNANLNSFNEWANQAVNYVEKKFTDNDTKKKEAVAYLTSVLKQNKLLSKFTDEEIDAAIEFAVNLLPHSAKALVASSTGKGVSSVTTPDEHTLVISAPSVTLEGSTSVLDSQSESTSEIPSESQPESDSSLTSETYVAK